MSSEKPKKNPKHYINKDELQACIKQFYDSGDETMSNKLAKMIFDIADHLSYSPNFINYPYKEDMIGDAIHKMVSAIQNKKYKLKGNKKNTEGEEVFDEKGNNILVDNNPFGYLTRVAFHAFINKIKKEKKNKEGLDKFQEHEFAKFQAENPLVKPVKVDCYDEENNYE